MTKRAAIYTRVSTKGQAREGKTSLETQLNDCRKLAEDKGFEVIAELRDIKTGTDRKRQGFLELCRMVEANEIDVVIAWKEDRLYRGLSLTPLYDAISERREVEVVFVVGIFDRSMMAIMAGIAQKELEGIQERMENGMRARLRKGQVGSGKPKFGYKSSSEGYPEVDETDAGFVRDIFDWYIKGITWREIMLRLKAKGCGRKWVPQSLRRVIDDRTYADGMNLVTRTAVFGEELFEITYPKIIDKVTFAAAQKRLDANRDRDRSHHLKYPALCAGLIRCGAHDYGMRLVRRKRKQGKVIEKIYRCDWHHEHKLEPRSSDCAKGVHIPDIDFAVWTEVFALATNPARLMELVDAKAAELEKPLRDDVADEVRRLENLMDGFERERQKAIKLAMQTPVTPDDLTLQLDGLEFEKMATQKELDKARAELLVYLEPEKIRAAAEALVMSEDWRAATEIQYLPVQADIEIKRSLTRKFVDKVTIASDKTPTIYWKIEMPLPDLSEYLGEEWFREQEIQELIRESGDLLSDEGRANLVSQCTNERLW